MAGIKIGSLVDEAGNSVATFAGGVATFPNDIAAPNVTDVSSRLTTAEGSITSIDSRVTTNEADIAALQSSQTSGFIGFETKALMDADLAHAEGTLALVTNDATAANNTTYRKTGGSGSGSWVAASTDRITAVEAEVDGITGGATASDQQLKDWFTAEAYRLTSATPDSDGVLESGTVVWPDGSAGTFTRTAKDSTWLMVTAYTISHTDSSKTVTQSAITINSSGFVTAEPEPTVA